MGEIIPLNKMIITGNYASKQSKLVFGGADGDFAAEQLAGL